MIADISLLIKNVSLDARTLNYSKNCAIYKSDQFTSQNPKKAEIYITKFIMECRDALNKNKIYYDSI